MPSYQHPGVYMEEIPSGVRPIEGVATSVAAFLGPATQGPLGELVAVQSLEDYERVFGAVSSHDDAVGLAASAFYRNGGKAAYFVRLASGAAGSLQASALDLAGDDGAIVLRVTAVSAGAWGDSVYVRVRRAEGAATFSLDVGRLERREGTAPAFRVDEVFADLTMHDRAPGYALTAVNSASRWVRLESAAGAMPGDPAAARPLPKAVDATPLAGGRAAPPRPEDYRAAFARLARVPDVSVIVLPGAWLPDGNAVIAEALAHCAETRDRVLLVDVKPGVEIKTAADIEAFGLTPSSYAVCYYPWVKVPNPFVASNPLAPTLTVPPSAFAAGVWSRVDATRGVWKAPAGVETALNGVAGLEFDVGDGEQDRLNPAGINCLRKLPGFGPVIWGARTLATHAEPEWRYVPVRRTALFIERSVYNGVQWAVFESNDHRLWSSLRANIGSFMEGLFRAGALQGEKVSDAYFVRCGLGDTMTQGDVDRGQVIVVVGFAPLKPAEFVIVRIQQKVQQ